MAATWVDAEAASNMRPCQGIDPSKLKIENQQGNNNNKCDTHAFHKKSVIEEGKVTFRTMLAYNI